MVGCSHPIAEGSKHLLCAEDDFGGRRVGHFRVEHSKDAGPAAASCIAEASKVARAASVLKAEGRLHMTGDHLSAEPRTFHHVDRTQRLRQAFEMRQSWARSIEVGDAE